jgi:hypothetical protein
MSGNVMVDIKPPHLFLNEVRPHTHRGSAMPNKNNVQPMNLGINYPGQFAMLQMQMPSYFMYPGQSIQNMGFMPVAHGTAALAPPITPHSTAHQVS